MTTQFRTLLRPQIFIGIVFCKIFFVLKARRRAAALQILSSLVLYVYQLPYKGFAETSNFGYMVSASA